MITPSALAPATADPLALRRATDALETGFLTEMLTAAGLGRPPDSLGGGAGEAQFASLLVAEQAAAMVAAGGIGLSEQLFRSLTERMGA